MTISIVTPTWNNVETLIRCVESVRDLTRDIEWRMIVVNNGSTDGTHEYLTDVCDRDSRITVLDLPENLGFIGGTNAGLATVVPGEHVLLLNDDTQVTDPDWLVRMRATFDDPQVGAVGPVSNYASAWQAASFSYQVPVLVHSTQVLIGFCMLIRSAAFQKVGLLDDRFGDNQFDDYDISWRLIDAGYKLMVRRDVFLLHYGNASTGKVGRNGFQERLKRGKAILVNKWGDERLKDALSLPEDLRDDAPTA